ncbi:hypothetical protein [Bradyrhizobium sp.]|jgi:hypothetical protein|uniref:hypothetical protein n=1 Tax=Bradyrhizobium sp. TaxID=376 RepID=UPI0027D9C9F7|nr:hypothetical protein [Bradyrhizobium sp.]MDU1495633.1 hypothetical protein [Bradyrhizobium sp.]MDU1545863.1 hypothetical protein [Bradyrhizobium sp.]MDU1689672.1 hypothetical protein [Bradyrhizobium sp.]MDU3226959.1 hypothetical protein [Bradyrhizobium sp.]MDU6072916.1 hypothetical protein [Bradyrhizobium sp.]
MGVVMKIPKGTMIRSVLAATVKAFLMRTMVRVGQSVVEAIVRVIAVVFVIMSQSRHNGQAEYHGGRQKCFS